MFDVITIGAATRDIYLQSKNFKSQKTSSGNSQNSLVLPLGEKVSVENIIFETGGGATNAAFTFARQGLKTATLCRIGNDPGGQAIVESLEQEGIDTSLLVLDNENYTGYSVILVADNGERTVLVHRGASANFPHTLIQKNRINSKWLMISSLGGNIALIKSLLSLAEKNNIKVALLPGSSELSKDPKTLSSIFAKSDVVILNNEEAALVTNTQPSNKDKITHSLCLMTRGIGVITDGPHGAVACDKGSFYKISSHQNKAVERTGAGDAFASGFVAGLIKYSDIAGALELATDNSSSVVRFFGAKKGILYANKNPFKDKPKVIFEDIKGHKKYI